MDFPQTSKQAQLLSTPQHRQRLVTAALDFVKGTPLFPSVYEHHLLEQFVQGSLTIEQVIVRLDKAHRS
jgi:hypothetical protein